MHAEGDDKIGRFVNRYKINVGDKVVIQKV